jgi:mono/diheme cytochrome c family protein
MARQPRADSYEASPLFIDGKAGRPLVSGTVARGQLRDDPHLFEGRVTPNPRLRSMAVFGVVGSPLGTAAISLSGRPLADVFPFEVTPEVLARGRQRYEIFCAVCHGPSGHADGLIVERGYTKPPSYHEERLRQAPVGHFFDVMTRGYGAMPQLATEVPVRDRWAIAAHIRVLQAGQHVPLSELSPEEKERLPKRRKGGVNE